MLERVDSSIFANSSYLANYVIYGYASTDFDQLLSKAVIPLVPSAFDDSLEDVGPSATLNYENLAKLVQL